MKITRRQLRRLMSESIAKILDKQRKYQTNFDIGSIINNQLSFENIKDDFIDMFLDIYMPLSIIMIDNYDPEDHTYDFRDSSGNYYDFNPFAGVDLRTIFAILNDVISRHIGLNLLPVDLKIIFGAIVEAHDSRMTIDVPGREMKELLLDEDSYSFMMVGPDTYGLHGTSKLYNTIDDYVNDPEFDSSRVLYHNEK